MTIAVADHNPNPRINSDRCDVPDDSGKP